MERLVHISDTQFSEFEIDISPVHADWDFYTPTGIYNQPESMVGGSGIKGKYKYIVNWQPENTIVFEDRIELAKFFETNIPELHDDAYSLEIEYIQIFNEKKEPGDYYERVKQHRDKLRQAFIGAGYDSVEIKTDLFTHSYVALVPEAVEILNVEEN